MQVFQEELNGQIPSYDSVMKEGKVLMKNTRGDGKEKELEELKQEWENVSQLSVARQRKLEEAGKTLEQFYTQLSLMKEQMSNLPFLDITERVHGDVDTVTELLEDHTVRNIHPMSPHV